MAQTLPGDLIDVQGDKNTSAGNKNIGLTFGHLIHGPRMTTERVVAYLFKYMAQIFQSKRL